MRSFIKYKDLFVELVKTDIKIKYKNSYLGVFWSLLNPLLMMIILTIIFSEIFKQNIPNYPVYVLIGRLAYSFFSESTSYAMESIINNSQLVKKVYIPKAILPLAGVGSSFVMSLISIIPVVIVMLALGMKFSFYNLLIIVPLILLLVICIGFGLLLSTIFMFFRDLTHLYSVLLMILMYMTPIFYPAEIIPKQLHWLLEVNPLSPILYMMRDLLMFNQMFPLDQFLIAVVNSLVYLCVGAYVFWRKQEKFVLYV